MKIVFDKLQTSKETIQVSLDGGTTWNPYIVSEIIESGIPLDENQDYEKIQIKGSSTVLKNLDVVKSIEIPESSSEIFTHDGTCFHGDIVSVKIPESFTSIGDYTFYSCTNLTSIDIPNSVTSIGNNAFSGCSGLTGIDLPESLTEIGHNAFYNCSSLASIDLPESVTFIGTGVFSNCSNLTSITLPEGVTSIGSSVFYSCSNLTSIDLPESLTEIGRSAFSYCTSLKTINFKGTEDQWNAITKGSSWNNSCPSDMRINYNYQSE